VDPYGKMQMCQLSRKSYFDLKRGTFDEGWNTFFPSLLERRWQTQSACRRCNLRALCGSCPGAAEMENGDLESAVVAFCEIAHLRAEAFMGPGASGHRPDATCCLGRGRLASRSAEEQGRALAGSSCGGSCSHSHDEPKPPALIQIQRSR
jgi:radical SAM protein with 4Fe4S-binding SPASM domain